MADTENHLAVYCTSQFAGGSDHGQMVPKQGGKTEGHGREETDLVRQADCSKQQLGAFLSLLSHPRYKRTAWCYPHSRQAFPLLISRTMLNQSVGYYGYHTPLTHIYTP